MAKAENIGVVGQPILSGWDEPGWYLCDTEVHNRGIVTVTRCYYWDGKELRGYKDGHFLCEMGKHRNFRGPLIIGQPTFEEIHDAVHEEFANLGISTKLDTGEFLRVYLDKKVTSLCREIEKLHDRKLQSLTTERPSP